MIRTTIQDETAQRVSGITNKPLTKGFDSQVNELCDEIDLQRNGENPENDKVKKLDCLCPESKEVLKNGEK